MHEVRRESGVAVLLLIFDFFFFPNTVQVHGWVPYPGTIGYLPSLWGWKLFVDESKQDTKTQSRMNAGQDVWGSHAVESGSKSDPSSYRRTTPRRKRRPYLNAAGPGSLWRKARKSCGKTSKITKTPGITLRPETTLVRHFSREHLMYRASFESRKFVCCAWKVEPNRPYLSQEAFNPELTRDLVMIHLGSISIVERLLHLITTDPESGARWWGVKVEPTSTAFCSARNSVLGLNDRIYQPD